MRQLLLGLAALTLFSASGCYSFKGISIDYSQVKTYFVDQFDITALNAEPTIAIRLTEDLKEKNPDRIPPDAGGNRPGYLF